MIELRPIMLSRQAVGTAGKSTVHLAAGSIQMNTDYRISQIRELRDQQVRFAPRAKKGMNRRIERIFACRTGPFKELSVRLPLFPSDRSASGLHRLSVDQRG